MTDFGTKPAGQTEAQVDAKIAEHFPNIAGLCSIAASGFDTPPSNLENALDGDLANPTGIGVSDITGGDIFGNITITLPAAGRYLVGMKVDFWNNNGELMEVDISPTCKYVYDYDVEITYSYEAAEGCVSNTLMHYVTGSDFRLSFYVWDTAICSVKIYDITVVKMP